MLQALKEIPHLHWVPVLFGRLAAKGAGGVVIVQKRRWRIAAIPAVTDSKPCDLGVWGAGDREDLQVRSPGSSETDLTPKSATQNSRDDRRRFRWLLESKREECDVQEEVRRRALRLTPQDLGAQTRQAVDAAQQQGRRELSNAVQLVNAAATEMQGLVQGERAGRDQDRWLAIAGGTGLVVGMILWACFSGPVARALPASWSVPEKMAAATLHLDRWDAGARLMQSASPPGWAQMVAGVDLEQANTAALDCLRRGDADAKATAVRHYRFPPLSRP